jgi:hypothetical protein
MRLVRCEVVEVYGFFTGVWESVPRSPKRGTWIGFLWAGMLGYEAISRDQHGKESWSFVKGIHHQIHLDLNDITSHHYLQRRAAVKNKAY